MYCSFDCDMALARKWDRVVLALGGQVDRGARPDPHIKIDSWTNEDWEVWNLGANVEIDDESYGAISFYRRHSNSIYGSWLGSLHLLRLFRAAGAENFTWRGAVGDSRGTHLATVSVEVATKWFEFFPQSNVSVESHWPESPPDQPSPYTFPVGSVRESGSTFDVSAGMTIDTKTDEFLGYVYIRGRSLVTRLFYQKKLESVVARLP